jgi:antitoxin component YwqK of YwqJK toxin-antitoxin module
VGDHEERGSFVIGLREGIWRYYYPDGSLKYEGNYVQGNPDKRHKYYYPDGTLKEEQYYAMGIREKNWKKYDEEGNLEMTITYRNNQEQRINGVRIKLPESDIKLIR